MVSAEPVIIALPWAWMRPEQRERHVTEPGLCVDCGMDNMPRVPRLRLCPYCAELRQIRGARWSPTA